MELTYDVLVHIFKYLTKLDRMSASETCRSWYEAANDNFFRKNKVVKIHNAILEESLSLFSTFEDNSFLYSHYIFSGVDITRQFNNFWKKKGDAIRTLTFEYCVTRGRELLYILEKCSNLESLDIIFCIFSSKYEFQKVPNGLLQNSMKKLKRLNLTGITYLTDAMFARFMSAAPALEEFDLTGYHETDPPPEIGNEYYPDEKSFQTPSDRVLTFDYILHEINLRAKHVKRLTFIYGVLFHNEQFISLIKSEDLKLESFKISMFNRVVDILWSFTAHQVSLRELNVSSGCSLKDDSFIEICRNLVNLESLNIEGSYVTDLGIKELPNMKKLKSLNIAQCRITQSGFLVGVCGEVNNILEYLNVKYLKFNEDGIILISERLPSLRSLYLGNCREGVTDMSIPFIYKNLLLLQTLDISFCTKVTDTGFAGLKIVEASEDREGDELVNYNYQTSCSTSTEHLNEIVSVAEHKLCNIYCTNRILDINYPFPYLKNLKELDVTECNGITDISLTHAFIFKGLSKLTFYRCHNITQKGLEFLVKNCPNIEYLSIKECRQINDLIAKETAKNLRRLKELTLELRYLRFRRADNEIDYVCLDWQFIL